MTGKNDAKCNARPDRTQTLQTGIQTEIQRQQNPHKHSTPGPDKPEVLVVVFVIPLFFIAFSYLANKCEIFPHFFPY